MINNEKIAILLIKKKKTKSQWAEYLGISKSTLTRKLNGTSDFFREEIIKSCEFFGEEDMSEYFFDKKVAETEQG